MSGSILHVADGIHVVVENTDDENGVLVERLVEDQVAFVGKSPVSRPYLLGGTACFRVVAEEFQAASQ
jgi:hypothetical protein